MAQIPPLLGELHREIMGYIVLHEEPILDFYRQEQLGGETNLRAFS